MHGHAECVRTLLRLGADPLLQDNEGSLAADLCPAYLGALKQSLFDALLAAPHINVNQARQDGGTPLIMACEMDHVRCVKLLIAALSAG